MAEKTSHQHYKMPCGALLLTASFWLRTGIVLCHNLVLLALVLITSPLAIIQAQETIAFAEFSQRVKEAFSKELPSDHGIKIEYYAIRIEGRDVNPLTRAELLDRFSAYDGEEIADSFSFYDAFSLLSLLDSNSPPALLTGDRSHIEDFVKIHPPHVLVSNSGKVRSNIRSGKSQFSADILVGENYYHRSEPQSQISISHRNNTRVSTTTLKDFRIPGPSVDILSLVIADTLQKIPAGYKIKGDANFELQFDRTLTLLTRQSIFVRDSQQVENDIIQLGAIPFEGVNFPLFSVILDYDTSEKTEVLKKVSGFAIKSIEQYDEDVFIAETFPSGTTTVVDARTDPQLVFTTNLNNTNVEEAIKEQLKPKPLPDISTPVTNDKMPWFIIGNLVFLCVVGLLVYLSRRS